MDTKNKNPEPYEILENFYKTRGINEYNLHERRKALVEVVKIPNFPYGKGKPCLYDLEVQFLKNQGFKPYQIIMKPKF